MTLATMYGLCSQRLNEAFAAGGPTFYPTLEIVAALNEANRLFCLLTLALENTVAWNVPAATTFFHLLAQLNPLPVQGNVSVTGGSMVGWVSGTNFEAIASGMPIVIGGVFATIAYVTSDILLTLDAAIADTASAPYSLPSLFPALPTFPGFIVPLRIANATGGKVRPARFSDLWALDSQWVASPGAPLRYAVEGADLLGLYKQPAAPGTVLSVTYAQADAPLVNDADTPAIPAQYHPLLVDYACYRPRQAEGGDALQKALPLLENFLAGASAYAEIVRARNKGSSYDAEPFELVSFDRSRLVGASKKRA